MAVPAPTALEPASIETLGLSLVRVSGLGFADQVSVSVAGISMHVVACVPGAPGFVDVLIGGIEPGKHALIVQNLDSDGAPVAGELATMQDALEVQRPSIAEESDLARLIRKLLRELKRQVIENVGVGVSVDYDNSVQDGSGVVMLATLPALVLAGPTVEENRFYSINDPVDTARGGGDFDRRSAAYTVDLRFTLIGGSTRTVELFNLMSTATKFLNRNRWLEMDRDASNSALGSVRYEMDPAGDIRVSSRAGTTQEDSRIFTTSFIVRGFDLDEGAGTLRIRTVDEGLVTIERFE